MLSAEADLDWVCVGEVVRVNASVGLSLPLCVAVSCVLDNSAVCEMVKDFPGGEGVEVTVTERDCEPVQVLCCEKVSEFEKESEDESESDGAGLSEPRDADTVHEAVTTFESEFWLGLREEVSSTLRDTLSEGSFVSEKLAVAVRVTVTDTLADSRVRDLEMESVFVALSLKDLDLLPIVTVREGPDFENDVELDSDVVTNAENVPDNDFESV